MNVSNKNLEKNNKKDIKNIILLIYIYMPFITNILENTFSVSGTVNYIIQIILILFLLCFEKINNKVCCFLLLFIIESIGINFLHNKKIGLLILVIHYITNIIIGFFYRNYYVNLESIIILKKDKESFVNCLTNSIYKTIKILLLLFGIITFFMLITSILKTNLKINSFILNIICGLLEMTQGIYYIASSNINIILKASIITFFLSFGGISIHMQVFSILKDYKLKYSNYLLARIFHGLISFSLVYLVLSI